MPQMTDPLDGFRTAASALDGLNVAMCVFDTDNRTLLWNRTFLRLFPEHAGFVHVGEPYSANLRRFYVARLAPQEMPSIDRYIDEGIARHNAQQRPFTFKHLGTWLRVASESWPGGRIRLWTRTAAPAIEVGDPLPGATRSSDGEALDLYEHVVDGIMLTRSDNRITWVNEHFVSMYGLPGKAAAVDSQLERVYQDAWRHETTGRELLEAGLSTLDENLRFAGASFELPLPGARWIRVVEHRRPNGIGVFAHVDISALKRQQLELKVAGQRARDSEARLRDKSHLLEATLEWMDQGVMMINADRVVDVCNRRAMELLGLPQELMASKPLFEEVLAFQWSTDEFMHTSEEVRNFVKGGGLLDQAQCYDRKRPDGRVIEVRSVPMLGGGVLRTYTDITDRRRREDYLHRLARYDGLTALVNREAFLGKVEEAIAKGSGPVEGFAVHYLDLDAFKPVNDRFGHAVGDKVLASVAERMQQIARDQDVVGRMGGDEFAVLQPHVNEAQQAIRLAARLLEAMLQPFEIEGHVVRVGLSVGIALFPTHGATADELMRNADAALYGAKAAGRNTIRLFAEQKSPRLFGNAATPFAPDSDATVA